MVFAPDTDSGLRSAVALVNTAGPPDTLTSITDADRWWTDHFFTGRRVRTERQLRELRALRPQLRALLLSERDDVAAIVNRMLADAHALPQLGRHGDLDWHVHAISFDAPVTERIKVETAMAMIDLVRLHELSRLSVCADDDCDGVVLDLSRNRSRRFCSTRCSNRDAAAAYRARNRSAAASDPT